MDSSVRNKMWCPTTLSRGDDFVSAVNLIGVFIKINKNACDEIGFSLVTGQKKAAFLPPFKLMSGKRICPLSSIIAHKTEVDP